MDEWAMLTHQIRGYVLGHLSTGVSLDSLAGAVHYSPAYLSRAFKSRSGYSLYRYVNSLRLARACRLLRGTDQRISDIAAQVGITSASYFHRIFKEAAGVTPQQYRQTQKEQIR